jgi:urease accessory protein
MFDNALLSDTLSRADLASRSEPADPFAGMIDLPQHVRVDARLKLHVDFHAGATRLTERREEGAMRFRFPRAHGRAPEAILVNIAGGLAGGDGASIAVSSAAAERIYRSAGAVTTLSTTLTLHAGATGLWLPQETILHDGARVKRSFSLDLAADSSAVFGEMLFFGRRASGEGFGRGGFAESWRVRRNGRLILADETRLTDDFSADILRPAALAGYVALATLLFAHAEASEHLDAIRALLPDESGLECGATDLGGLILIRFAGENAAKLRRHVVHLADNLAGRVAQPLPRALMN